MRERIEVIAFTIGACALGTVAVIVADSLPSFGDSRRAEFLSLCVGYATVAAACTAVAVVVQTIRRRSRTNALLLGAWAWCSLAVAALLAFAGLSLEQSYERRNVLLLGILAGMPFAGAAWLVVAVRSGRSGEPRRARRR